MDFQFSEEQQLLADSVGRLIENDYDFESRKKLLHSDSGYSDSVWSSLGEMGVLGIALPEEAGGFGMGITGMVPVMEAVGRGLLLEPLVSTMVAARLVQNVAQDSQAELLGQVAQGAVRLALAHTEDALDERPAAVATKAVGSGDAYKLSGQKIMVLHGPMAQQLVVTARTDGKPGDESGLGVFLVDAGAAGLTMHSMRTVDGYRAADLALANVPAKLLGEAGKAFEAIDEAVDFGCMLVCAESIGAMSFANETTLEYLKTRKQFGQPIGAFQALQHRMVDMTVSTQQARSMVFMGADALDRAARGEIDATTRRKLVSATKIKVADAVRQVGQEAIQLHGGMGMTDEMKVSHTFKRLTMIGQQFGDVDHHLARFAANDR
ncbi:MAG: acyl-CoA dehydrogenase family protein [Burkholderiaceae bacterium]